RAAASVLISRWQLFMDLFQERILFRPWEITRMAFTGQLRAARFYPFCKGREDGARPHTCALVGGRFFKYLWTDLHA
ncbi:MAG TPA: hypothetical protein VJL59_25700, partial [Anaerolineales bacterium]|nr:hypothetical protein [Anaerolineales bacterium]